MPQTMTQADPLNTGMYRANLHYSVTRTNTDAENRLRLRRLLYEAAGPAIVYASTAKAAGAIVASLAEGGLTAGLHHGRLPVRARQDVEDAFMSGVLPVLVVTNAFCPDVEKPDVRLVVHSQAPGSLDTYYEESARAGYDGEAARCVLLYGLADRRVQKFFPAARYPDTPVLRAVYRSVVQHAGPGGITKSDLMQFIPQLNAKLLRVALKQLTETGVLGLDRSLRYRAVDREPAVMDLAALAQSCRDKARREQERLERMSFYARTTFCRWKVILEYLGEAGSFDRCGTCDNCRDPPERKPARGRAGRPRGLMSRMAAPTGPAVGSTVRVARYGEGRVLVVKGDQITLVFPDGQTRTFLAGFVEPLIPR